MKEIDGRINILLWGEPFNFEGKNREEWIHQFILSSISIVEKIEPTKMTWLPMCGFIAQLVEHRTDISRGGHGFESRWSPEFSFRLLFPSCINWWAYGEDDKDLMDIPTTIPQILHNYPSSHGGWWVILYYLGNRRGYIHEIFPVRIVQLLA